MRRNTIFNHHGLTFVEAAVAMLMLAIVFAGIGYLVKTVPIKQRAYHSMAREEAALALSYLLTRDIKQATEIVSPVEPTVATTTASTLELNIKTWDQTLNGGVGDWATRHVEYEFNQDTRQILRCETAAADCTPTEELLNSWDNGRVGAEAITTVAGAPNGTIFRRGIDVDGNIVLSSREKHYIRVELVLSQNEGPAGNQHNIDNQVYYIEARGNL